MSYICYCLSSLLTHLLQQLAALLITRQVIGNVREALLPYIIEKFKMARSSYELSEKAGREDTQTLLSGNNGYKKVYTQLAVENFS